MRTDFDPEPGPRDRLVSIGLFLATLVCVYWVYGRQWLMGDPFRDREIALGAAKFAGGLMSILLAHEMGHYVVARAHGFRLSLPYFLPFPSAFGTFGAIIRLKSLPRTRTGLLEMGAAGPLAGFAVALLLMAIGLPGTVEVNTLEMALPPGVTQLPVVELAEPGMLDQLYLTLLELPVLSWLLPAPPPPHTIPMIIMANPPVMDILGELLLGAPPGRYATLDPLAMAGWVGCLITAINLVPIGQLDGGHVFDALFPAWARPVSKLGVGLALFAGTIWLGWAVWGVLLLVLRAWRSLPVPLHPPPTRRSRGIALATLLTFVLCFMPRPVELVNIPFSEIRFVTAEGEPVLAPPGP